jgi:hypothetical protein
VADGRGMFYHVDGDIYDGKYFHLSSHLYRAMEQ